MRLEPDPNGITLRHAVDLLQLTATQVRGLGQYQDLQRLIPVLIERVDELASILEELGADHRVLLGGDDRLSRLVQYVDHWKSQMNLGSPPPRDRLIFAMHGLPLLSQLQGLKRTARQLVKAGTPILVSLSGQELRLQAGEWKLSIPARFDRPGSRLVRPVFLKVLLDRLKESEWVACTATDDGYGVNSWWGEWPKTEE